MNTHWAKTIVSTLSCLCHFLKKNSLIFLIYLLGLLTSLLFLMFSYEICYLLCHLKKFHLSFNSLFIYVSPPKSSINDPVK